MLGRALDYLEVVQLWLNLPRVRLRRATEVALGLHAALSTADLPREWADALAVCQEEAEEIDYQMRSARQDARAKAKRGG